MGHSTKQLTWSTEQLAHACDVVVHGLRDQTPFDGNPAFIDAMETCAKLLRGNAENVRDSGYSSRQDGTYLFVRVKDLK